MCQKLKRERVGIIKVVITDRFSYLSVSINSERTR